MSLEEPRVWYELDVVSMPPSSSIDLMAWSKFLNFLSLCVLLTPTSKWVGKVLKQYRKL